MHFEASASSFWGSSFVVVGVIFLVLTVAGHVVRWHLTKDQRKFFKQSLRELEREEREKEAQK